MEINTSWNQPLQKLKMVIHEEEYWGTGWGVGSKELDFIVKLYHGTIYFLNHVYIQLGH